MKKALPRGEHGASQSRICRVFVLFRFDRPPGDASLPGGWRLATGPMIELSPHEVVPADAAGGGLERMPNRMNRGYVDQPMADREERVSAAPFELVELQVGVLFGDDEE